MCNKKKVKRYLHPNVVSFLLFPRQNVIIPFLRLVLNLWERCSAYRRKSIKHWRNLFNQCAFWYFLMLTPFSTNLSLAMVSLEWNKLLETAMSILPLVIRSNYIRDTTLFFYTMVWIRVEQTQFSLR